MLVRKCMLMAVISLLLSACSTTGGLSDDNTVPNTTAGMGERYLLGHGVPQDNQKAFAYFSKAADEGDIFAQNELAYMYAAGKGTSVNKEKAFYWYQQAAEKGLASAQYNLALMYLYGIGTSVDKAEGKKWLQKSAAHQFEPALVAIGKYKA